MSRIEKEGREAVGVCGRFVEALNNRDFARVEGLVSDEFEVYWPLTREKVNGIEDFIAIKQQEQNSREIRMQNSMYEYDEWDKTFKVFIELSVYKDGEHPPSGWNILLFNLDQDGAIVMLTEYFINCSEPLAWRKDLVELY